MISRALVNKHADYGRLASVCFILIRTLQILSNRQSILIEVQFMNIENKIILTISTVYVHTVLSGKYSHPFTFPDFLGLQPEFKIDYI